MSALETAAPSAERAMVNEVFFSIQGESTWAGRPCVFLRFTGCHLRCAYCDTAYAFYEGRRWSVDELVAEAGRHGCDLAQVTGGEPLLQPAAPNVIERLCDAGHTVLVETSGACDVSVCDPRAVRVMDIKTPSSGEAERTDWANLDRLRPCDEIKLVLGDAADYRWARGLILEQRLAERVRAVLVSPVFERPADGEVAGARGLALRDLADWVLADRLPVKIQTQLHKQIWHPDARGV